MQTSAHAHLFRDFDPEVRAHGREEPLLRGRVYHAFFDFGPRRTSVDEDYGRLLVSVVLYSVRIPEERVPGFSARDSRRQAVCVRIARSHKLNRLVFDVDILYQR